MARPRDGGALAAGSGRLHRGRCADQPAADIGSLDAVAGLGDRTRLALEPGRLCRAYAATPGAALQPKRRACDRSAIPHPLGFAKTFGKETRTPDRGGEPRA